MFTRTFTQNIIEINDISTILATFIPGLVIVSVRLVALDLPSVERCMLMVDVDDA